jgi:hypothetical protein
LVLVIMTSTRYATLQIVIWVEFLCYRLIEHD